MFFNNCCNPRPCCQTPVPTIIGVGGGNYQIFRGPTGATGATGPIGPTGATGASAVAVTIGTTTTGLPGSQASVTNSGTDTNPVLNFTIPQGPTGAAGPAGTPGADGATGATGPSGIASVQSFYAAVATGDPATGFASQTVLPAGNNDVSYDAGTFTINTPGDYEIYVSGYLTSAAASPAALSVDINGTPSPVADFQIANNEQGDVSSIFYETLSAGDTVDLTLSTDSTQTYTRVVLNFKRIVVGETV